jgi:hypothetical protein
MDAGQNYITLPNGKDYHGQSDTGCSFQDADSIKVHTHGNKVFGPNGDVMVSGCSGGSPDVDDAVDAAGSAKSDSGGESTGCRLFNNTDCSSGHDIGHIPVRETRLLRHFYTKTLTLPRQARDKHRKKSKQRRVFLRGLSWPRLRNAWRSVRRIAHVRLVSGGSLVACTAAT